MLYAHGAIMGLGGRVPPPVDLRSGGLMAVTDDEHEDGEPDRRLPAGAAAAASSARAIEALPGLARIAASAGLHTAAVGRVDELAGDPPAGRRGPTTRSWRPSWRTSSGTTVAGRPPARPRGARRRAADVRRGVAGTGARRARRPSSSARSGTPTCGERGEELLMRSRDVWNDRRGAPGVRADPRRPGARRGPDPAAPAARRTAAVGRRPHRRAGRAGHSRLVAPGLTMIGARAGCRYLDEVPSYLNNLFRLGLVWFSREPLRDPMEYQVRRGAARRARGDALGAVRQGGAAQHPPHAVRRRTSASPCWRPTPTPPSTRRTRYRWRTDEIPQS